MKMLKQIIPLGVAVALAGCGGSSSSTDNNENVALTD